MSDAMKRDMLREYRRVHGEYLDGEGNREERLAWFGRFFDANFAAHFGRKDARILEIGCGKGYFLKVLRDRGYTDLHGIDLSEMDVDIARTVFAIPNVCAAGAVPFLSMRPGTFDAIFAKDVLEHIPREDVGPFLEAARNALAPGGTAIFQVPNMDWAMSSHERYMDWTHESGFTRESLGQVMRMFFPKVEIFKVSYVFPRTLRERVSAGLVRRLYLSLCRFHLRMISEGAEDVWFECREIAAVCRT